MTMTHQATQQQFHLHLSPIHATLYKQTPKPSPKTRKETPAHENTRHHRRIQSFS